MNLEYIYRQMVRVLHGDIICINEEGKIEACYGDMAALGNPLFTDPEFLADICNRKIRDYPEIFCENDTIFYAVISLNDRFSNSVGRKIIVGPVSVEKRTKASEHYLMEHHRISETTGFRLSFCELKVFGSGVLMLYHMITGKEMTLNDLWQKNGIQETDIIEVKGQVSSTIFERQEQELPHNPYDHYPLESEQLLHPEYYPEVIPDDVSAMPEALQLEAHYHCPATLGATGDTNRKIRTGYFAGVSFLDQQIEKIFQALKDEGIFDNTLIIYTSDHGDMLGDHGLYSKGAMFYEQGVNVPLIVKFPHQTQGCRSEDLVMLEDMFSTIYTAAGGDASFRPESLPLQGEKKHEFAMTEYRGCGKFDLMGFPHILHATMIRTAEWKLNLYHDTCDGQLFHLTEDPQEKNNLYHDPASAGKIMELMQMYLRYDTERDYNYNAERGGRSGIPGFAKAICEIKL